MKITVTLESWLKALRSGEYKQTKNVLTRSDRETHCCLGVMCEIDSNVKYIGGDIYRLNNNDDLIDGLFSFRPVWMSPNQEIASMYANDELNWSFDQIADWWEAGGKVKSRVNPQWPWVPDFEQKEVE